MAQQMTYLQQSERLRWGRVDPYRQPHLHSSVPEPAAIIRGRSRPAETHLFTVLLPDTHYTTDARLSHASIYLSLHPSCRGVLKEARRGDR